MAMNLIHYVLLKVYIIVTPGLTACYALIVHQWHVQSGHRLLQQLLELFSFVLSDYNY